MLSTGILIALAVAASMDLGSPSGDEAKASFLEGSLSPAAGIPTPHLLDGYQVTYRTTAANAPPSTEVRSVDRPFYGRDVTYGPGGQLTSGVVTNALGGFAYLGSPKPHWGELEAGTYRATGDEQPAQALQLALAHHEARVLGWRSVIGRRCLEVRTGGPAGQAVTAPTASNYADLCLDRQTGQILDELWILHAHLVRHRSAVAFTTHPRFGPHFFDVTSSGPVVPDGQAGSESTLQLNEVQAAKLPVTLTPPPGYRVAGVQAQVTEQTNPNTNQLEPSILSVAHYVSGPNLFDLEQGDIPPPPEGTLTLRLRDGRSARLTIDLTSSYLDVTLGQGYLARLEGPDLTLLERMATQLQVHLNRG